MSDFDKVASWFLTLIAEIAFLFVGGGLVYSFFLGEW